MAKLLLVFGATGGTGTNVVRFALESGLRVRAFARSPQKVPAELRANHNLEIFEGDLIDMAAIDRAVKGVDYIIATAGNAKASKKSLLMFAFVKQVVASMRKHGVARLLYQAGAFSPTPDRPNSVGVRIARVVLGGMVGISGMLRDNDAVIKYLVNEAKDLEWFVTRPARLKDHPSKGKLKPSEKMGSAVHFVDVAAFSLAQIQSGSPPRQCPYLTY